MTGLKEFLSRFESPNTRRSYNHDLKVFKTWLKKDPSQANKIDVLNFLNYIKDKRSSSTVHRWYATLRSYFSFLVSIDVLEKNPADVQARLPVLHTKERKSLTDSEIERFLSKINNSMHKAIIYFMLYNGLRRSEVGNLRWEDIGQEGEIYTIRIHGKGDKIRTRPIHPLTFKYMKEYLKESKRKMKKSDYIFIDDNKNKIEGYEIYRIVEKYAKEANLENFHPHAFRAKFASMALESGVPITSVQEDLGHASVDTTSRYDRAKRSIERSSVMKIKGIGEEHDA